MKTDTGELLRKARTKPDEFPGHFSGFIEDKEPDLTLICRIVLSWILKSPASTVRQRLPELIDILSEKKGIQSASNILARLEVTLGYRKPSLGIYDHALHVIGGAQKYGCTIAHILQGLMDITLISNKPVTLEKLQEWYNLDLHKCKMAYVPIPFFEEGVRRTELIDPSEVNQKEDNPFHVISRFSGRFDFFLNNSMLEMVYPLSNVSLFICHFPEREKSRFFHVDKYTEIIYNSRYTAQWIEKKWSLTPRLHIYPPVDMEENKPVVKERIILSVSRFDPGGNKQQIEMIKVFRTLVERFPQELRDWRLVLAGGSVRNNPYLERIRRFLMKHPEESIEVKVNMPEGDLRTLYRQARIFWHFCGLNQKDPAKVEHFGMNIVEAMQNDCVPIVFKGGGQTEIVEDGFSGYLFQNEKELMERTMELIRDPELVERLGPKAHERGQEFHVDVFVQKIRIHFDRLMEEYKITESV